MDINQVYADIQNLNNLIYEINKREKDAISELNRLHKLVYGTSVTAGCSNCHIKAFKKLLSLTIIDLETMENQKFKISKDALIEYPARSGQFYSAANGIDDETAVAYLSEFPKMVKHFDVYPKNEDGELDLSGLEEDSDAVDLSKLNKAKLQAEYKEVFGEDADDSLTKAQLIEKIKSAPQD